MSTPNDGGPAFPEHHYFDLSRGLYGQHITASEVGCGGMSLRDYFAAAALTGILANHQLLERVDSESPHASTRLAASAYAFGVADAMLAARERKAP